MYSLLIRELLTSQAQYHIVEEQVEFDDPYINIETPAANFEYASSNVEQVALKCQTNDHHQTTTLVYVPVDLKLDNATLQSTIFVNV